MFEGAGEGGVVLLLTVDAGSRCVDVIKVAFEVRTGLILCGKVVVRLQKLLVLDDLGGVTIDRGVFVRADVPDGGSSSIRRSGGGQRRGFEAD